MVQTRPQPPKLPRGGRFITPRAPCQNAKVESFKGRQRTEGLDVELIHNLADAQLKIGPYRNFPDEGSPHSSLGSMTPFQFRRQHGQKRKEKDLTGYGVT